jgi:hypothetical protein
LAQLSLDELANIFLNGQQLIIRDLEGGDDITPSD